MGPIGSGKTTLMKLLAEHLGPSAEAIDCDDSTQETLQLGTERNALTMGTIVAGGHASHQPGLRSVCQQEQGRVAV